MSNSRFPNKQSTQRTFKQSSNQELSSNQEFSSNQELKNFQAIKMSNISVTNVRCANDLFEGNGKLKPTPFIARRASDLFMTAPQSAMVRPQILSTIRLSTGKIVEHGFVCPKDEANPDTGFFASVKQYVRNMPLGAKIGTVTAFALGGFGGTGIVLGVREISRQIGQWKNKHRVINIQRLVRGHLARQRVLTMREELVIIELDEMLRILQNT